MYSERFFEETPTGRDFREIYLQAGRLEALQHSLVNIVRAKYPDLAALAQQQASRFDKTETLDLLIAQVAAAESAHAVRQLLESGPKSQS
jgi:hypothetical protein